MTKAINIISSFCRRHQNWCVLTLFFLLTIIAGWQLITHIDTVIAGSDADSFVNLWADWWTAKAMFSPDLSLWETDYLFYPQTVSLAYHSFSHLNSALSILLQQFLSPVVSLNLVVLLNYPLAGFAMYQLARYLTRSTVAGILAGIFFAFNSHNLFQSTHPVLLSVWCIPWVTLYFLRAMREKSWKLALVAAVFVWLGTLASMLLTFLLALWLMYLTVYLWITDKSIRSAYKEFVIFILASSILVLPIVYQPLKSFLFLNNTNFVIDQDLYILDMLLPFIPHWYMWLSATIYIGIVPLFFTILSIKEWHQTRLWYGLLFLSYIFAIGPTPSIFGYELDVTLPWSNLIVPFLRNPYRLSILISFALSMLVAYGWLVLRERVKDRNYQIILGIFLGFIIFFEFTLPPFPTHVLPESQFFTEYLPETPPETVVAMLPIGRFEGKQYIYYQTLHNRKMTNGVVSRHGSDVLSFIEQQPLLQMAYDDIASIPNDIPLQLQNLHANDVDYLVFNKPFISEEILVRWREAFNAPPFFEDELVLVYSTSLN